MYAGNAHWAGIETAVFGMTEARFGELAGDHPENMTMDLPCRAVFAAGRRPVEVRGPYEELQDGIFAVHDGFRD